MDPQTAIEIEKLKINHENEKKNTEKDISKINDTIKESFTEIKKSNEEVNRKIDKLAERPTVSPQDLKESLNEFHQVQSEDRKRLDLLEKRGDRQDGAIGAFKWLLGAATGLIIIAQVIVGAIVSKS